jgi:molybdenum cofactor biosynthesis protein MoaC
METTPASPQWADNFRMIDVGAKPTTRRRAIAAGTIELAPAAFEAIRAKTNPKGDVLALAEIAGIMAAKKTSDLIPLCHPLPLEKIRLHCELDSSRHAVTVSCEVSTSAKTGVEMEALCGVNGALLTIYDLSKAVDPAITISSIRLVLKEGGKSSHAPGLTGVRAAVITVSDRASRGETEDTSGAAIAERLAAEGTDAVRACVADERPQIVRAIQGARESGARLIVLTGGTGLSPRDVTPEALEEACDRLIPGFGELLRSDGSRATPMAWLSRSNAGTLGGALVVALPGGTQAVREGLDALVGILPHALHVAQGGDHDRVR